MEADRSIDATVREQTLERLVKENHGWLMGWLRGRVSDPELAHDVCQDAFLKALRSVSTLEDRSKFPRWLYRIAENTLRDHLRRRKRRKLQYTGNLDDVRVASEHEKNLDTKEDIERLLAAVRTLPPQFREPLLLRHARDLSYAEIGRILGLSPNAVQVRVFRARRLLRKTLQESKP